MKIEYIIEGNEYESQLYELISQKYDKIKLSSQYRKIDKQNNYIFEVECNGPKIVCAKTLSNISQKIQEKLNANKIKFYILLDDPSKVFAKNLYPLICEFETKLREFIYLSLFDINEQASKIVVKPLKDFKSLKNIDSIPKNNFLENSELSELLKLLFSNAEFIKSAKQVIEKCFNSKCQDESKYSIIKKINQLSETTIWNQLFAKIYSDSILPKYYNQTIEVRNKVMHFHSISYKEYKHYYTLFSKLNKDLDMQIKKGIVLEATKTNIHTVSSNKQYSNIVYDNLLGIDTLYSNQLEYNRLQNLANEINLMTPSIPTYLTQQLGILQKQISPYNDLLTNIPQEAFAISDYLQENKNILDQLQETQNIINQFQDTQNIINQINANNDIYNNILNINKF